MIVLTFISLVFGTFVSEDLACITAGLLIQRGELGVSTGILACTVGIFVGDFGLWGVGRVFGRAALGWPWVARQLKQGRVEDMQLWLTRHAAGAIVGSRFLPGTRLPLYVIAGVLELPWAVFGLWTLVGTVLWTPAFVLVSIGVGGTLVTRVSSLGGIGWASRFAIVALLLLVLRIARALALPSTRARIAARLTRWSRRQLVSLRPVGLTFAVTREPRG